jgi:hypothetical protein
MAVKAIVKSQRLRRFRRTRLQHFTTVLAANMANTPNCFICDDPYDDGSHTAAIRLEGTACTHVFGRLCLQE